MSIRTLIVEDEKQATEILKNYLSKYCPAVELVATAATVDEATEILRRDKLDLVFLDVEMPYGNAFDLLDRFPERRFETVFVTAYDQYARQALNEQAVYYLLKPVEIDEVIKAVDLVANILKEESRLNNQSLPTGQAPQGSQKISLPTGKGYEIVDPAQVIYCEADDNYTKVYRSGDELLISKTLKFVEDKLPAGRFQRIHRSYLVNTDCIKAYHKGKGGSVLLTNGREIPVSPNRKLRLLRCFK